MCGQFKSVDDFAWRRRERGQRDNYCRPCRAEYKRTHYAANEARSIEHAQRRTERIAAVRTEYLLAYFRDHPCADCGETDPLVLEFDHLGDKQFTISSGIRVRAWQAVLDGSPSAMSCARTVIDGGPPNAAASFGPSWSRADSRRTITR